MDRVGIIGYGHMGSMLVNGFLTSGVLAPGDIAVASRSRRGLDDCAAVWPGIEIAATNTDLARRCRTIIVAVRPQETMGVLREIVPVMDGDAHIVSLAAGISLQDIEGMYAGPVSRVVPTVTSAVGEGTTLVCHGRGVGMDEAIMVENLFSAVGNVMPVREEDLAAATLLSSCGPGLLAAIIGELAGAAARASNLPPEQTLVLATDLLTATAACLRETGRTPEALIEEVATRGGVTEVGVQGFRARLPGVFDEVFTAMLERCGGLGK